MKFSCLVNNNRLYLKLICTSPRKGCAFCLVQLAQNTNNILKDNTLKEQIININSI